ncbi:Sporulation related domain-containing protein [Salinimicrobium catena]|uniref:Sporulation related domain-containing protein n=1 Tax=Salinimicrobium catena TaxID=390640 RepID=A0A1H5H9U6_9FLAO|nr:SPOR domain-containing protein [Salinimicrobium catena]SDK68560.1 Sporulation related domain-containing protein [Salinimicrobium catena]SEE24524.1 Sporulation related domain-containing protein [Salinimicrobium catena]
MLRRTKLIITSSLLLGFSALGTAQEGTQNIVQDERIPELLALKTQMTKDSRLGDRYRIQLYSGDNNQASKIIKEYRALYPDWPSTVVYETPNYKVWVGNFRNSLEADRALLEIKKTFPAAFRFKPEKR